MKRTSRSLAAILCVVALATGAAGCRKLKARDALNKGVRSYKAGLTDSAIEYFKQAKELDPGLITARLYLATAYSGQYIPGAPSEENLRNGKQAIAEFQEILKADPNDLHAMDGIGSILFLMGSTPYDPEKFKESKKYHQMHIKTRPQDPEPYYWIGVIDWSLAFRANTDARAKYNNTAPRKPLKDVDPLPDKLRADFAPQYGPIVDEGIEAVQRAIQLRPDYDDAMAYLNLLYRQKADMVATPEERDDLLRRADDLVDKVKAIKQRKMQGTEAQEKK
jgi:tetratricopeptide (TPR) repeat protein